MHISSLVTPLYFVQEKRTQMGVWHLSTFASPKPCLKFFLAYQNISYYIRRYKMLCIYIHTCIVWIRLSAVAVIGNKFWPLLRSKWMNWTLNFKKNSLHFDLYYLYGRSGLQATSWNPGLLQHLHTNIKSSLYNSSNNLEENQEENFQYNKTMSLKKYIKII